MMWRGCLGCVVLLAGCVTDDINDIGRMFEAPTPAQAARWAFDQNNPDLRREGVVLLATSSFGGGEVYLKLYRDYVENDTDPLVKSAAIIALARHGTPEDALLIAPWAQRRVTDSVTIRWSAVQSLQRLHNSEVVGVLIGVALDPEEQGEVRSGACIALGQYPEDRVAQALIMSLDAPELAVNVDAAESLHLLTGQRLGLDLPSWSRWYAKADEAGDPFTGQLQYHYPTYQRDKVWWEHAAFWLDESWEPSLPPVGLRDRTEKRTWEDFDQANGEAMMPSSTDAEGNASAHE